MLVHPVKAVHWVGTAERDGPAARASEEGVLPKAKPAIFAGTTDQLASQRPALQLLHKGKGSMQRPEARPMGLFGGGRHGLSLVQADAIPASVRLQMQSPFALKRPTQGVPAQPRLLGDVTQRHHHAFFHALEAADVEVAVVIAQ